jgi:ankyrin repeat protein
LRDQNGYTPLLKAASIGRVEMCKALVENGVDPRQRDPFGNTPLDKANLYSNMETEKYLSSALRKANETEFVDWNHPDRVDRSGKWRSWFHY